MLIKKNIIWSLIPAKGNSQRVPFKNLKKINGLNLFLYSVVLSVSNAKIHKTFVSTDNNEIRKLAISHGAKVPFLRPKKISKNISEDHEYIFDFIYKIRKFEDFLPEYIIQLRPTTPFRSKKIINQAINKIYLNQDATSLRSSHIADHPPEKQFRIRGSYYTDINLKKISNENFNKPSQTFKKTFEPNGYVDILKTSFLLKQKKRIYGNRIIPFITKKIIDIDTKEDFDYAETFQSKEKKNILKIVTK